MDILKTKDAAELLSVSQTTVKRWASAFPDFFPKDKFGHYIFTEQELDLLRHIQERINQGDTLEGMDLPVEKPAQSGEPALSAQPGQPAPGGLAMDHIAARMDHLEHALERKADEVVSIQLLQQRKELEELRQRVAQLAAALEAAAPFEAAAAFELSAAADTVAPFKTAAAVAGAPAPARGPREAIHPAAASMLQAAPKLQAPPKLQAAPKKRGLLRSFFSFL